MSIKYRDKRGHIYCVGKLTYRGKTFFRVIKLKNMASRTGEASRLAGTSQEQGEALLKSYAKNMRWREFTRWEHISFSVLSAFYRILP